MFAAQRIFLERVIALEVMQTELALTEAGGQGGQHAPVRVTQHIFCFIRAAVAVAVAARAIF